MAANITIDERTLAIMVDEDASQVEVVVVGVVGPAGPAGSAGSGSVTSAEFAVLQSVVTVNSAQMTSADAALSLRINSAGGGAGSVTSQQFSALSAHVDALSNAVSVADASLSIRINSVNAAASSTSVALESHINAVSQNLSALVLDSIRDVSVPAPADGNILMWNSAAAQWVASVAGGSGSVTSQELSVAAAALSVRIDTVSNAVSAETSNRVSADNALSGAIAANSAQMTSADNAISAAQAATSAAQAATSAAVTSVNNRISALSTTVTNISAQMTSADNAISAAQAVTSAAVTSVNQVVSALSQRLSALVLDSLLNVSAPSPTDQQVLTYNSAAAQWVASTVAVGTGSVTSQELSVAVAVETSNRISADNALSNLISALSVVVSNQGSAIAANSANVTSVTNRVSANSATLSNAQSAIAANSLQMTSADNAISNAVSVLSTIVSNQGSAIAANSLDVTSLKNRVSAISGTISAISADLTSTQNRVSANSATLSNAQSAIAANSAQMVSADNAISNAVSIVSVAQAATSAAVTSVNQVVSALSQRLSALVLDSLANVSTGVAPTDGNVLMWNSVAGQWVASAVAAGAGSVTSTELSAVSAAAASAAATLSVRIDSVFSSLSTTQSALSALSAYVNKAVGSEFNAGVASTASIVIDWSQGGAQKFDLSGVPTFSASNLSAGRTYILRLSEGTSAAHSANWGTQFVWPSSTPPTLGGSSAVDLIAFYSDGTNLLGSYGAGATGAGSVTSQELSVAAAALSGRVDSVASIASAAASAVAAVSADLTSVKNTVSANSADVTSLKDRVSANSADVTSLKDRVSANSATLSNAQSAIVANSAALTSVASIASAAASAAAVASANITSLKANWLSGLGTNVQLAAVTGDNSVSAAALAKLSGLSLSMAANAVYQLDGYLMHTGSALSIFGFGVSTSSTTWKAVTGRWIGNLSVVNAISVAISVTMMQIGFMNEASFGSVTYSATCSVNTTLGTEFKGMFATSSTGGSIQFKAKAAGSGVITVRAGSYMRAYRLI